MGASNSKQPFQEIGEVKIPPETDRKQMRADLKQLAEFFVGANREESKIDNIIRLYLPPETSEEPKNTS